VAQTKKRFIKQKVLPLLARAAAGFGNLRR